MIGFMVALSVRKAIFEWVTRNFGNVKQKLALMSWCLAALIAKKNLQLLWIQLSPVSVAQYLYCFQK